MTHEAVKGEEFSPPLQVAANQMKVDRKTAQHGRTVLDKGSPELIEAVEQSEMSVSAAAEVAREYAYEP